MQALMIYTSKCNNLNILRYDVSLFILRLINVLFIFITQLLVGPPVLVYGKFVTTININYDVTLVASSSKWWNITAIIQDNNF